MNNNYDIIIIQLRFVDLLGTEDPMEHDALPVISTRMAKFVTSEVVRGRSLFPALTAHGK